ncbi:MAG: hypothetical protein NTW55_01375 [Planctomycetota bacterium]|nr:hypothetical protein [Planctomycetota bacterium]
MPRIDEQEILHRLELISQIKPSPESTARAMERVRRVLVNMSEKGAAILRIDEIDDILRRVERLSQTRPSSEWVNEVEDVLRRVELLSQMDTDPWLTAQTIHQVRTVLVPMMQEKKVTSKPIRIWGRILRTRVSRFAAAAIFTIFILLPLSYGAVKIIKTYFFQEKPTSITTKNTTILSGEGDENRARKVYEEINQLREAGKCEKTLIKEWVENGIVFQRYKVRYTLASGEAVTMIEDRPVNDTNDADANQPKDEE